MMDLVLRTKLFIPPLYPEMVPRPRLFERLDQARTRKLALISAPAGFGKSTLVSAWVREQALTRAWLSLDEGDNDVTRFLVHLEAALREAHPEVGETLAVQLQSPQISASRVTALLTTLVNRLASLPEPLLLVLDDLHLVDDYDVYQALEFFIEHLPPQVHLLLLTREDPPLPLSRFRVRGEMVELRAADLRFSHGESEDFLNEAMELGLTDSQIATLEERTEGWAAGLKLAALALRRTGADKAAQEAFIQDFAGDDRLVMDYLVDEVLAGQPGEVQTFLLTTSILERFSASLCDALLALDGVPSSAPLDDTPFGTPSGDYRDSQAILEYLERANLFLIPLDHRRRWYRYHHLFRDLLRYRLQRTQRERVAELHRRAGEWLAERELVSEALHHFLSAKAYALAADLIEARWESMVLEGQIRLYLESMRALPPDIVRSRPVLCVADGLAQFLNDWENREQVERRLQAAERAVAGSPAEADLIRGYATAVRSVVERVGGGSPARIIRLSEEAQRLLPENLLVRYFVDLNLYFAHLLAGEVERALEVIREAYTAERSLRNPYLGVTLAASYGQLLLRQGRLREALALYREALERFVAPSGETRPPFAELVYGGIGRVLVELNDLDAAARELDRDPDRFPPGDETLEMYVHLDHARLCEARGDVEGARRALQHARAERFVKTELYVDAFEARMQARRGELARAEKGAREAQIELAVEPFLGGTLTGVLPHAQRTALVQLCIAQQREGAPPEAPLPTMKEVLDYLEGQLTIEEEGGWWSHVLTLLILQALAYDALGQREMALDRLERALTVAAPEGFARIFIDEGAPMARLLYDFVSREADRESAAQRHARRLLTGFQPLAEREEEESDPGVAEEALVEPLSERELEVLALIAEGLTNPEIAERLYISIHTVKSHASNLYGKLAVGNRTQAVQKARTLGLL